MRCGLCDKNNEFRGVFAYCSRCKNGEIYITNEEWFGNLPTGEKAKVLSQLSCYQGNVYELEKWLRATHNFDD